MKAFATACILLLGAAVVLWYGNTVNSWVLGGLAGGLAALLISIPISLMFFSHLVRRHDRLQKDSQAEASQSPYEYSEMPLYANSHENEVEGSLYELDEVQTWLQETKIDPPTRLGRSSRMLPPPRSTNKMRKVLPRGQVYGEENLPERASSVSEHFDKQNKSPRTTRQLRYTSNLYSAGSQLSRYKLDALRTARLEAAKQQEEHSENPSRLTHQHSAKSTDHKSPQKKAQGQSKTRAQRTQHTTGFQRNYRGHLEQQEENHPRRNHTSETDFLRQQLPRTELVDLHMQSELSRHNDRTQGHLSHSETTTGNLQRPVVRRAPYLYDDDPLRQELAPYSDNPVARRSSRHEVIPDDQED